MSDDQNPSELPPDAEPKDSLSEVPQGGTKEGAPAPVAPGDSALPAEAKASPPKASATGGVIDYALPAQRKFWLPTPAMIRNIGCLVKMIAVFTFLLCFGYFALVALNPKARQWALQGTKAGPGGAPPSGKGPTPFKVINQVLAIPAQAMGKTDDVVKANNARVGQLDGVIAEEEGKQGKGGRGNRPFVDPFANAGSPPATKTGAARAAGAAEGTGESGPQAVSSAALLALAEKRGATTAPAPAEAPAIPPEASASPPKALATGGGPQTPNQMKLAGDIVIAHASPAGTPRASAAFFYSIVKLNVSGITQGKPARALINNRLAYEGDEINRQLGIVFAELNAASKLLVFRDKSGALVTRSY